MYSKYITDSYNLLIKIQIMQLKNGRALAQTLHKGRYTNGQQDNEKVLSTNRHQEKVNKNHSEIPLHTHQNG